MAVFDIIPTHPVLLLIVRYLITFKYFPCSIATTYVPGFSAKKRPRTDSMQIIHTLLLVSLMLLFLFFISTGFCFINEKKPSSMFFFKA